MLTCPSCGQENPDGFRFCGGCGAVLAPARAREVRKTVTVLFADVTGSTALGERLDPESLRRVMSRYFVEMKDVLERYGGTVEKFIGDAIMAVFGVPTLHEDDALRALHAATAMRERLGTLNPELDRDFGVRLPLKGKTDPVAAYRMVRVLEGAPAFERRLDAPLVGRREELARVRGSFDQAALGRSCRLVTVFGPPGIGKSRLALEVADDLHGEADVFFGRCLPYGEGITSWPLREIFVAAGAEDELDAALAAGAPEEILDVFDDEHGVAALARALRVRCAQPKSRGSGTMFPASRNVRRHPALRLGLHLGR